MKLKRIDSISMDQTYYTDEGYLVDHPIVTTCGIFEYKNDDGSTRRELRLPENVFDKKSLESYKGKPIIITHDAGEVDKENVRREQIGTIMSEGYRDGDSVRCEINDQRERIAADKVRKDAKEVSNSTSARKKMIANMTGGRK